MSAQRRQGELTLGRWIRDRGLCSPGRVALEQGVRTVLYGELDGRSEGLAGALLGAGLRRGDRVASLTLNRPEHVELFFACAKAGLTLVPLSHRLAAAELAFQLADAEPRLLFVEPGLWELGDAAVASLPLTPRRVELTSHSLEALSLEHERHALDAPVDDGDGLLLLYTSGTTGRPKGALLTHANCFWTNLSLDRTAELSRTDVVLQILPQFHAGGWNVQPLLAWWKGATVVLEASFDPAHALALIAARGITTMMGVPASYLFMAQEPAFAGAELGTLRQAMVGGAPMPRALLRAWIGRGVEIVQGYGLTEAAPNVLCLAPEEASRRLGWAGRPYPHVEVALQDLESGRRIEGAGQGELLVRGPAVFPGYWRDPEATARVLREGWLHTGDIAERDGGGCYRICDRLKDMYISGGENVYPAEVEAVLHEHPAVADSAVLGLSDRRWGEAGVALVVARAPVEVNELLDHCRERLARFKVPREIRLVDGLPRSATGKLLKQELRARLSREGSR